MYYKLSRGGRVMWSLVVFIAWCFVTWHMMRWTVMTGMEIGDAFRVWTRSAGYNPALSDVFKLFSSIAGFILAPILSTVIIVKINKRLKGNPHEQERREGGTAGEQRKRLPPASGGL